MAELDIDALIDRYRLRALAVRERGLPPVAGDERKMLIAQAEQDYLDFALVAAAKWEVEGGVLLLRIPLRPEEPPT